MKRRTLVIFLLSVTLVGCGKQYELRSNCSATKLLSDYNLSKDYNAHIKACTALIAVTEQKDSWPYLQRGLAYQSNKNYAEAVADFSKVIDLNPDFELPYQYRAETYNILQQYDKAVTDFDRAIRLNKANYTSLHGRGIAKQKLGDIAGAEEDLTIANEMRLHALAPMLNGAITRAQYSEENGEYDKAIAQYTSIINLDSTNPTIYYNRGVVYHKKEQFSAAINDYNEALRLKPNFVKALNNRGDAYDHLGEFGKAIAELDNAIHLQPDFAELYVTRGNAKLHKGDKKGGEADLTKAKELGYEQ